MTSIPPGRWGALFTAVNALDLRICDLRRTSCFAFEKVLLYAPGPRPLQRVAVAATASGRSGGGETSSPKARWEAKKSKDFAVAADRLRRVSSRCAGWSMLDGKDGFKLEPIKKG
jgi:cysteinyl-tRNA synthetase